jgi:hypothetical protein
VRFHGRREIVALLRFVGMPGLALALLTVAILTAAAPPALASPDGARIMREVRQGERSCGSLSRADFVAVGEYVMGTRFESAEAHEAMDRLMDRMMGERAEEQMHEYMGRRATGCGGGSVPGGFMDMMGMMGTMAGSGGGGSAGMMGGAGGSGSMMNGFGVATHSDDDGWGAGETVMTILMAALLVVAGAALWILRSRGRAAAGEGSLDVLGRRFAAGEIDAAEYAQRRKALEAGP